MNNSEIIEKIKDYPLISISDVTLYQKLKKHHIQNYNLNSEKSWIYNFEKGTIEGMARNELYILSALPNYIEIDDYNAFHMENSTNKRLYFKYIPELKIMAIYLLSFNINKFEIGEKRCLKTEDVVYLTKDRFFIYKNNNEWKMEKDKNILRYELPFSLTYNCLKNNNVAVEIANLLGVCKRNENHYLINSVRSLIDYLFCDFTIEEQKCTKKMTKLFESVIAIELPEFICTKSNTNYKPLQIAQLYCVNSEISVIRWFLQIEDKCFEYMRFYCTDQGNFICNIDNDKKFHLLVKNINKSEMIVDKLVLDKKELTTSNFKYFLDIIDTLKEEDIPLFIYEMLRFPLIEKFAKTGLNKVVQYALRTYKRSRILPYTTIEKIFMCKISPKETNIFTALGVNKYQYKRIAEILNDDTSAHNIEMSTIMESLRIALKGSLVSIKDINNQTFDDFLNILTSIKTPSYYCEFIQKAKQIYSLSAIMNGLEAIKKISTNDHCYSTIRYLTDYVSMVKKINDTKSFPLKFKSEDSDGLRQEIKEKHDSAVIIYNYIKEECNLNEFKKQTTKWKKWEYFNSEFSVIAPEHPADLSVEGTTLHHCVKNYIDKVAEGKTNILFIRKTEELDKPFFTVEISNSGTIEQVHGFGNRNTNTEPALENFIKEWSSKKKLKSSNYNKIR